MVEVIYFKNLVMIENKVSITGLKEAKKAQSLISVKILKAKCTLKGEDFKKVVLNTLKMKKEILKELEIEIYKQNN